MGRQRVRASSLGRRAEVRTITCRAVAEVCEVVRGRAARHEGVQGDAKVCEAARKHAGRREGMRSSVTAQGARNGTVCRALLGHAASRCWGAPAGKSANGAAISEGGGTKACGGGATGPSVVPFVSRRAYCVVAEVRGRESANGAA
ncbi:hypothetical protein DENSPDRAFT_626175 [Dentipellis sp. KUC8613]|nr:hypothetical protein DENSPDRAFT_626175 [Dentipellis sp. KUC8613]